jgi:dihydroorotase
MSNYVTMPGFIDMHTHLRESGFEDAEHPGLTYKETMRTGAESALAGGVMVLGDQPNTDPVTNTIERLARKVQRAQALVEEGLPIDVYFYFSITAPEHLAEFERLCASDDEDMKALRMRCAGIKLFLENSTGNLKIPKELVPEVFRVSAKYDALTMAHCEDADMNAAAAAKNTLTTVEAHSIIRPPESEAKSIEYALSLVRQFRTRFHIAHLTTRQGVELVRNAKREGLPVTTEVTVHNLLCSTDDYATLGTRIKMNPPIRSREHLEALAEGVMDGTIDCIITDHAPHTIEEKNNPEPLKAPSGVPGVETRIPLLFTIAAGRWPHPTSPATVLKLTHDDIIRTCFTKPNEIYRLGKKLPEEGGDSVVIDTDAKWTIHGSELHSKCGWTPYEGWEVQGRVVEVKKGA